MNMQFFFAYFLTRVIFNEVYVERDNVMMKWELGVVISW